MLNPVRGLIDASAAGIALLAMVVLWLAGAGDLSAGSRSPCTA